MNSTLNTRPCRVRADANLLRCHSAQPSGRGCPAQPAAGPLQPGSPGHAHGLPDGMPAPAMTVKPGDLWPPASRPVQRPAGLDILLTGLTATLPRDDARLPPEQDTPAQATSPPRQPRRHCARRAGPGRGRHDRPMITNTDHKSRAQKSPSPPPGASGTKYLSSSRTAVTSAAAASLISARSGSSGLSGRILRLSRGGLSGPRTSSDSSRPTTPASITTTPTTCTFRPWEEPRRGRAGGAARGYRPGSVLTDARPGGTSAACWALSRSAPGSCRSV